MRLGQKVETFKKYKNLTKNFKRFRKSLKNILKIRYI